MRKIVHRLELDMRRRLRDHLPQKGPATITACPLGASAPKPLLPPRGGLRIEGESTLVFHLLGRELRMPRDHVNWSAPGPGSAHQLMRMNLHYMEYLEHADDGLFSDLVDQWIRSNPACQRGAWRDSWNSYALSLRVVVWMQQLATRRDRLDEALVHNMHTSLTEQLRFLEQNLETDLGGNHLIKNIKALVWASSYFAGLPAERWRAKGVRLLQQELQAQILPDGMHYERSASYHCQVLADLLEIRHALGGYPLGGALDEALSRMVAVVADLAHPDGKVALFNDSGLAMSYAPALLLDAYEHLIGRRPGPRGVFALPQAGYYGMRRQGTLFVADCGRIAPDDLPAHGHGDVLSFEWSVGGQRIIVDQGVFEYVAGARRQASRAAASHNTLCLQGADQADFFGGFRCGRRPGVEVRAWQPGAEGFTLVGAHDGFAHLPGRPRHVRRLDVSPRQVVIHDSIEGATDRRATIGFLLHPAVVAQAAENGLRLRRGDTRIEVSATLPLSIAPAVWWPDMGQEEATLRIEATLPDGVRQARAIFNVVSEVN
jgi:uncharacterized heparinase superfamily protein